MLILFGAIVFGLLTLPGVASFTVDFVSSKTGRFDRLEGPMRTASEQTEQRQDAG